MVRPWSRRRFLGTTGTVGFTALAGCSGMPEDAVVATELVDSVPEDAEFVVATELPEAEREIAREAARSGLYHECPPLSDTVRRFAQRTAGPDEAYLDAGGTPYGLWVTVTDLVYASSGSPPDENPDCGWF